MLRDPEDEEMTVALPRKFATKAPSKAHVGETLVSESVVDTILGGPAEEVMMQAMPGRFSAKKKSHKSSDEGLVDPSVIDAMLQDPEDEKMVTALPRKFEAFAAKTQPKAPVGEALVSES